MWNATSFERSNNQMRIHLKHLFVQINVNGMTMKKVLINMDAISKSKGVITLNMKVRPVIRSSVFIVVPLQDNYNLLRLKWVQYVSIIPSTTYQMMVMWEDLGNVEYLKENEFSFKIANYTDQKV